MRELRDDASEEVTIKPFLNICNPRVTLSSILEKRKEEKRKTVSK
jgi:hypothetical protein